MNISFLLASVFSFSSGLNLEVMSTSEDLKVSVIEPNSSFILNVGEVKKYKNKTDFESFLKSQSQRLAYKPTNEDNYLVIVENKSEKSVIFRHRPLFDEKDDRIFFQCLCLSAEVQLGPKEIYTRSVRINYRKGLAKPQLKIAVGIKNF